jgi:hypothetical protein
VATEAGNSSNHLIVSEQTLSLPKMLSVPNAFKISDERQSRLYFEYTIPILEKLTAAAKRGASEYFILFESLRPKELKEKEEREAEKPKAA